MYSYGIGDFLCRSAILCDCDIYALSLHVRRIPYVEATILELLRYKTVVPLGAMHNKLKDTEVGGYFIPRGTSVS